MWYVIQVINGREDVVCERIERMVPASAMRELFYPQFQTEIKVHGEWVNTTKPLFPGYLICDTADPRTVQQYLRAWTTLPGSFPRTVSLCRWQKKRSSLLADLRIGETAWCP